MPSREPSFDPALLEPDPVVDAYKAGIDLTLLEENLRRTPDARVRNMVAAAKFMARLRAAVLQK